MLTMTTKFGRAALAITMVVMGSGCSSEADDAAGEEVEVVTGEESSAITYGTLEYNDVVESSASKDLSFDYGNSWGAVGYEKYGDQFWLLDKAKDGESVGIYWRIPSSGRHGICRNAKGVQYVSDGSGGHYYEGDIRKAKYRCDKNFPEGVRIVFKMGRCNGSSDNCRIVSGYEDWTVWFGTTT